VKRADREREVGDAFTPFQSSRPCLTRYTVLTIRSLTHGEVRPLTSCGTRDTVFQLAAFRQPAIETKDSRARLNGGLAEHLQIRIEVR
jgi:hypothetical protein